MKKAVSEIWSIYGQIEAVVAKAMVEEGKATMIVQPHNRDQIPDEQQYNALGQRVQFAILLRNYDLPEFERRIAELRW